MKAIILFIGSENDDDTSSATAVRVYLDKDRAEKDLSMIRRGIYNDTAYLQEVELYDSEDNCE